MPFTNDQIEVVKTYVTEMLDGLPILAAQIGIRTDEHEAGASTPEDRELMDALLKVSRTWQEVKPPTKEKS